MRYLVLLYILLNCTILINAQTITYRLCKYSIITDSTVALVSFEVDKRNIQRETLLLDSIVVQKKRKYKVCKIEENAFQSHSDITHLYLNNVKQILLPETLVAISADVFKDSFNSLQRVGFPKSLKVVGKKAFSNMPSLTEVDITGVNRIEEWSFALNPSLSQVYLDSCVDTIGRNSFFKCTRLSRINLEHVLNIEDYAFEGIAIESLNILKCNIIGEFAFANCKKLENIKMGDSLQLISDFAFHNNSALRFINITSRIIGESSFMGCTSLNNVRLSDRIEKIGQAAFFGCSALKSINLPSSVLRIEAMTFMDCVNLDSIVLPENLTFIGESAFAGSGLTEIVIPATVIEVQDNAFFGCDKLKKIILKNPNTRLGDNAFEADITIEYE